MKSAFAELARRSGLSESDLLRQVLHQVLKGEAPAPVSAAGFKQVSKQVNFRLRADELDAVTKLAKADARSVPAWIVALVRRVVFKAEPFNARELEGLYRTLAALGPIGRNLNVVVKHFQQTGRIHAHDIEFERLTTAIERARSDVLAMAERANRRVEPEPDA